MEQTRKLSTKDMVRIGVFAALCAMATTVHIPFGAAMVHLGTGAILTVAILYGGAYAGLSGAIGSALFDLVMGHSPYTLWSFVIKGIAGLLAGTVARGMWPETPASEQKSWLPRALAGSVLAALWTLGGYVVAWWQVTGTMATALANMPSSLLTSGIGMVVALLLTSRLRGRLR